MSTKSVLAFSLFFITMNNVNGAIMKSKKSSFPHLQNLNYSAVEREDSQTTPLPSELNTLSHKLILELRMAQLLVSFSKKEEKKWDITKYLAKAVRSFNNLGKNSLIVLLGMFVGGTVTVNGGVMNSPTNFPIMNPTFVPSNNPSRFPTTKLPTPSPINVFTPSPTDNTPSPVKVFTPSPTSNTSNPTVFVNTPSPVKAFTPSPTVSVNTPSPITIPSLAPTIKPTSEPTDEPTNRPTASPSNNPTINPTKRPTLSPINIPSKSPSNSSSNAPTATNLLPTSVPTTVKSNVEKGWRHSLGLAFAVIIGGSFLIILGGCIVHYCLQVVKKQKLQERNMQRQINTINRSRDGNMIGEWGASEEITHIEMSGTTTGV